MFFTTLHYLQCWSSAVEQSGNGVFEKKYSYIQECDLSAPSTNDERDLMSNNITMPILYVCLQFNMRVVCFRRGAKSTNQTVILSGCAGSNQL
jgi:hypothetical protein